MVFLSNYLVFKIVLAALGRVDYPVAGDLELKYDNANKIYLSGGSLKYVDDATLYTTIGGETTSHGLLPSLTANGTVPPLIKTIIGGGTNYYVGSGYGGPRSFNMSNGGTVLVAGAEGYNSSQGLIYIYEREAKNRGEWKLKQTIYGNLGTSASFGKAVSINDDGDRIFVGADQYSSNRGRVLVYDRGSNGLFPDTPTHTLTGSNGSVYVFGWAIDCNGAGDKLIVGARNEPSSNERGAHHLYELSGGTWTRTYHRVEGSSNRRYGWSVAMNKEGDRFVVGGSYPGGWIWIFHNENGSWVQKIQISNPSNGEFGWSVAMNDVGNRVAVGCNTNRVYIYNYNGTSWSLFTSKTDNIAGYAHASLTPRGDYIAIHNHGADPFGSNPGAAYIYKISDTGTLTLVHTFMGEANDDNLGWHVYMSDDLADVVMGAKGNDEGGSNAGKLYVYGLDGRLRENIYITDAGKYSVDANIAGLKYKTNEVEVTTLNPGNAVYTNDLKETSEIDHGTGTGAGLKSCSVSLDGTRVAFGFSNGKAKVYHLETGVWTLKKEYTKSGTFGTQVCLNDAGTRLFVTDPSDNSNTGKVYVYDYSGSAWGSSETHSWTSPNGSTSDRFGGHAAKGISCNSAGTRLLVVNGYVGSKKAYIFDYNGSSWNTAPTKSWSSGSSWWGSYCALNDAGDRAFIGYENGIDIFHYDGSNWPTSATKNYTGSNRFGVSLTINGAGTRLLASSYDYSSGAGQTTLYDYVGNSWNTSATQTIDGTYGGNTYYGAGINMSRDGKRYLVSAHTAATYFSGSGFVHMMEDTTGSGSFTLKQIFKPDQADENMGSYSFEEGLCLDQKGYTAVIVSAGQEISRIYSSYPIPTLDFDNYNKLSIGNAPTNTSSKLFLGSNVYDIGSLTSDLTIETPGLYRGLVFDTSSNVAYFNKVTVGAIASTMVSYGKQDQVLNAGGDAGYGSGGDATQGGYGNSIDMSADGTRMVVGNAHYTDSNGRVWLYHLENGSWVLKQTWDGGTRLGSQVAMNEAGTRVFAVSPRLDSQNPGFVRIWDYSSGAWDTSASGTYSIAPGTISQEVNGVDCNKTGDVVIIGAGNSNNTWIYRLSGGSWSSEKNFPRRGSGVSMNGDGTRCFMGDRDSHKVWESNYSGGSWGTETEIIDESSFSGYWPASLSTDSAGETVCIKGGDSGNGAIYERAGNGSWSASVSGILSKTEVYGTDKVALSYDGTVAIFGHMRDSGALSTGGHALLYTKSGSTWSIAQTLLNPSSSQHSGDFFGGGTGLSKTAKDRFVVAAMGDDNAGTNYGAIYTYTNAIPDFISFDTYNKLSLSGITNPTSKIYALPTGAESTTTYDIGTATNIYIESAGTYSAEMKGSDGFALDSNVVSGLNDPVYITPKLDGGANYIQGALDNAGGLYLCGLGSNGQLGQGNTTNSTNYVKVKGVGGSGFLENIVDFKLGPGDGFVIACDSSGKCYAWGANNHGQLGQGNTTVSDTPLQVKGVGGTGFLENIINVSCGHYHSLACDSSGNAYAWGDNYYNSSAAQGQLGDGTTVNKTTPIRVLGVGGSGYLTNIIQVAGKPHGSQALSSSGHVYCWGRNSRGECGDGTTTNRLTAVQVIGVGGTGYLSGITKLAGGDGYYVDCGLALGSNGRVYAWGYNPWGQLGVGNTTNSSTPQIVKGVGGTGYLENIIDVACGGYHCFALDSSGTVYAWGDNGSPHLGDGTSTQRTTPVKVKGVGNSGYLSNIVEIGGERFGGSAMDADGNVYAWGGNHNYQIGDGTNTSRNAPVRVLGVGGVGFLNLKVKPVAPSLDFDGFNKYTFTGADTDSTYKLKYESNTYDLGTISNVYIANPGTYSAEIKGATNFALSSNVVGTVTSPPTYQYIGFGGMTDLNSGYTTTYNYLLKLTKADGTPLLYSDINTFTILMDNGNGTNLDFTHIFQDTKDAIAAAAGQTSTAWHGNGKVEVTALADGTALSDHATNTYIAFYFKLNEPTTIIDGASLTLHRSDKGQWKNAKAFGTNTDPSTFSSPHTPTDWTELVEVTTVDAPLGSYNGGSNPSEPWTSLGATQDFNASAPGRHISLDFDGYNKLTFSGLESGTTSNVLFNGNTYSIGTASNVYIENTGTYEAESKGTTTFALVSNVVGSLATNPLGNYRSATIPSAYLDYGSSSDRQVTICFWYKHTTDQPGHHADARGPVRLGTSTTASGAQCAFGVLGTFADGTNRMRGYTGTNNNSVYTYWDNLPSGFDETKWNFYIFRYMGHGNNHQMYLPEFDYSDNGSGNYGQSWRYVVFTLPDDHGSSLTDFSVYEGNKATTESWRTTLYNNGQIGGAANETTDRLHYLRFHKDTIGDDIGSKNTDISSGSITPSESLPGYSAPPSLTHDGYKLVVKNITPTSSKLKYESNTYEIGSATNIYVRDTGAYTAEIGSAADFVFTSNTVSGTIKTIEPALRGGFRNGHALTYDGKLYAWGSQTGDKAGSLGVGDSSNKTTPVLCTGITQGQVEKFLDFDGLQHRSYMTWIITTDNKITRPVMGFLNQIPGHTSDLNTFTDVTSHFGDQSLSSNNIIQVSTGSDACAGLTESGNVWTWGRNSNALGDLGNGGTTSTTQAVPAQITFSSATDNITKLANGSNFTIALDNAGDVWLWGTEGFESTWGSVTPIKMGTALDSVTITDIAASYSSMYAISNTGVLYASGGNSVGQIMDGSQTDVTSSSNPDWKEVTYFSSNLITVNKVYPGTQYESGGFVDTSDGWYAFGKNSKGNLGLGDTSDKLSPVKFTGVSNIKKFAVGYDASHAVTEDGKYYAWGSGTDYARGDNNTGAISYPKHIDALPNILAPSFEFDGYDKISSYDTEILRKVSFQGFTYSGLTCNEMQTLTQYNGAWNAWLWEFVEGGGDDPYPNASYDRPNGTRGQAKEWYKSKNDWRILKNSNGYKLEKLSGGTWASPSGYHVQTADTFQPDANGIVTITFSWNSHTGVMFKEPLYKNGVDFSTKFTKGTTTYDVGKASIITVPDTGTYDAQLSKGDFTLKSATVPATKASGLYTWAFHHGNFDNAYGDGDILTARDNGRFYADTPAYTGDIGAISTKLVVSSQNFASTITPTGTGDWVGLYYWNLDSSQTTTTAVFYELSPGSGVNGFELRAVDLTTELHCNTGNNSTGDPGWFHSNTNTTPRRNGVIALGETITLYRNYDPASTYVGSFTVTSGHLFSTATSNDLHTKYTFAPPSGGLTANVMLVAGGGSGGSYNTGGGGAGGLVYKQNESISTGTKTIIVGNGGASKAIPSGLRDGLPGINTTFLTYTAIGGGAHGDGGTDDKTGGSGGAGAGVSSSDALQPSSASGGFGNQGGTNDSDRAGGGGGGAGGAGGNGNRNTTAGYGGIGKYYGNFFGNNYGEKGWFAGGGGGGDSDLYHSATRGIGGKGGGGSGVGTFDTGVHGQSHTGGGGGGSGQSSGTTPSTVRGGAGGSGIVLLQTNVATPNANSEVKIPEPDGFLVFDDNINLVSRGPIPGSYTSKTIVNQPLPDGSEGPVFYSEDSYTYFGVNQGNTNQGDGSFQTIESVFMPIETGNYTHIASLMYSDSNLMTLGIDGNNKLIIQHNNNQNHNSVTTLATSDYTMEHGKWHHLVLTTDYLGNAKAYVNGYLVASERWSSMNADKGTAMFYRIGVDNHAERKYMASTSRCYYSELSPKEIMQLASSVGLGPKLEYDGLNTIKILNTEPGSSVKLFTSNVEDTSNVFIVADPAAGEYTVPESGKYYAEIKGTDTFTVTKTLDVSDTFPLYQYPPVVTGTKSSLTTSLSADTWNTWTMSGASTGNGQYQVKTSHTTNAPGGTNATAASLFTNGVKIEIISDGGASIYSFLHTSTLSNFDITLQLPSAKTIRKYVLYPADYAPVSTPGGSVDPTLPGGGGEHNTRRPKSWALKGSNDATSWTTIHTVTNKPPSIYGDVHTISSPASYQYYQLSISENNGSSQFIQLGEWQLWGDA